MVGQHRSTRPCPLNQYGVILVNPERHPNVKAELGQRFIEWVLLDDGQAAIAGSRSTGRNFSSRPQALKARKQALSIGGFDSQIAKKFSSQVICEAGVGASRECCRMCSGGIVLTSE